MFKQLKLALVLASLLPAIAPAQIIEGSVGRRGPTAFTSLSLGWFSQQGLCDATSSACWDFGSAAQWRASLEAPMGRGASFGVAGSVARVPLIYQGPTIPLSGTNSCSRCDANAQVYQILGTLHLGGSGIGFQQVVDASAGVTLFSNFRDQSGALLGPGKTVSDFTFMIGYGFSYGISQSTSLMIVQDYGLVIGKRVSGQSSNSAQQTNLRLGVRYGLGQ